MDQRSSVFKVSRQLSGVIFNDFEYDATRLSQCNQGTRSGTNENVRWRKGWCWSARKFIGWIRSGAQTAHLTAAVKTKTPSLTNLQAGLGASVLLWQRWFVRSIWTVEEHKVKQINTLWAGFWAIISTCGISVRRVYGLLVPSLRYFRITSVFFCWKTGFHRLGNRDFSWL